jgi:Flp pilus assembly protein TadD
VPKQPSRPSPGRSFAKAGPVKKKDDPDLTPPEEIRARRIRRILLLAIPAAVALGVGIYFAARPVGGAIKGWQSRRLAREAFAFIEHGKWSDANAKARDAYLLRPTESEAWRAIARLGSRTNQWRPALEWWQKVDAANRLTAEDRRDYIGAALAAGELTLAAKQVQVLMAQGEPAAADLMWAGQVAKSQNDPVLALDYAERVLADKRAGPYETASTATLVLSLTSPSSQRYAEAWKRIEDVARDSKNPASLGALILLANEKAVPPIAAIGENTSLSLESTPAPSPTPAAPPSVAGGVDAGPTPPPTPATQSGDTVTLDLTATSRSTPAGRTMTLKEVADALENHPDARPVDKLLALDVRARLDPALTNQYVADAVERFGNAARLAQTYQGGAESADETLLALATWLNKIGRPAKTLEVLPDVRAIGRQDLFLQYANALAALQRWTEIKDLFLSENSVVDPMVQHMYLAVAQARLGSATAATNEWQRALQVADTPEKLMTLAANAEQNSFPDTADAAYSEAIKTAPTTNRAAYAGRLRLALTAGDTAKAQKIAAEIAQMWPDDAAARNQDTYLRLLLGASGDAAEAAERDARVLVAKEPWNWQARATLGLACLRLGKNKEALAAYRGSRVTGNEPPGALAVRAAILAANGYEDGAHNDALLLGVKPLLPEERALVAPLLQ